MATLVGTQSNFHDALKATLELEYDAIEAYKAAISKLEDQDCRNNLQKFLDEHDAHKKFLTTYLGNAGEKDIPKAGDIKELLAVGKVKIAALLNDKSILQAMKTNEDDTNKAYENLNKRDDIPENIKSELSQFLNDEQKHRSWIEEKIKKL